MQHVVFQAIRQDEKVEAEVPVRIEGEIPAEKMGLVVLHQLDEVEVEALPKDLPDQFVVEGAKLAELHDKITVGDLSVPAGVIILTDPEHPIATVVETKAQMSEEEAEPVEGEVDAEGNPIEPAEGEGAEASEPAEKEPGKDSQ
jgi:large subunit ribosomal protein L25